MGKTFELLWRSIAEEADGWNLKNHSHLTGENSFVKRLTPACEERGICSAALQQLLNIVKYQIEDRSVVVLVLNKESAIWKDASMKTLLRGYQLKVIDVEGMKVVTNNRCVAEQIKSDRVESVATGGIKSVEFRNFGIKIGKLGKSANYKTDRSGRREIAQVNHEDLARQNREKHAILAETGEEQHVICMDDVIGKELP